MYSLLFRILLTLSLISGPLASVVQAMNPSGIDGKTVSFSELIREMESCTRITQFNNVKIRYSFSSDKAEMDKWWTEGNHPIVIKSDIFLNNCEFDEEFWLVMRDVTFMNTISFVQCKNLKIIFKNCDFHKALRMNANEAEFIDFENCRLNLGFKFERGTITDHLKFENTTFTINTERLNEGGGFDMQDRMFYISNKVNPIDLTFSNTRFILPDSGFAQDPSFFIDLSKSKFSGLHFKNSNFGSAVDLTQSTVENQFSCLNTEFQYGLLTSGLSINQMNATIDWENIKGYKLAIYNKDNKEFFTGKSVLGESKKSDYTDLISCYSNFYYTFKGQGNRFASNKCYIEWKTIEKNQQLALSGSKNEDEVFDSYFLYLMDGFLEYFCDYGTNPIKAILRSAQVILLFAIIYFISPTIIEEKPRRNFYSQLLLYSEYLKSGNSFSQVFSEHLEEFRKMTLLDSYRQKVISNKPHTPFYFQLFGLTFDKKYNSLLNQFETWVHRKIDIGEKKYTDLTQRQKAIYGTIFFLILTVCGLYFLFVRAFDSVILSLNMFCTLGFGELRVRGFAVYVTIIEGFVGWFLLSIFSVALLNQVLQ